MSRKLVIAIVVSAVAVIAIVGGLFAAFAPHESLAGKYANGGKQNYISGDGTYKEYGPGARSAPVQFSSVTDAGVKVTSKQYLGKVYVVNFWYAGCPPCRLEAPELESVYTSYDGAVPFLGVNIYDQAANSLNFAKEHGITYPSVIDTNNASMQYAFSKSIPPNAVPTTLVIDQKGRVAARVTGLLESKSILTAMIDRVRSEKS